MIKSSCIALFLAIAVGLAGQTPRLVVPIGHTYEVSSVAFSPNGKYVLTGGFDHKAKLWDLSGREIQAFIGHTGWVTAVAFSSDGQYVITGSEDSTTRILELNGTEIHRFKEEKGWITAVAISPDGKFILTGSDRGAIRLWEVKTEQNRTTFFSQGDWIGGVAFSPARPDDPAGGKYFAAGSVGFIEMRRLDGAEIEDFEPNSYWVHAMAFSPDGKHVLIGAESPDEAVLLDMKGEEKMAFSGHRAPVKAVAFSPDGEFVLTGSRDSTARLWNLNGTQLQVFEEMDGHINAVAFSPACPTDPTGGKYILTGNQAKTAKLWDRKGTEIQTFKGYSQYVQSVAFSADGRFALTGGDDNIARLWDLSGNEVRALIGHKAPIDTVAFSQEGKLAFTCSRDSIVKWWDMTGKEIQSPTGSAHLGSSAPAVPDGIMVQLNDQDFTATLKDLDGKEIQTFKGHADTISALACSPDGKFVLTGSWDNTTKLWDRKSGRELATMVSIDSTEWVVTTPSGLFDASPSAMRRLYYTVGLEVIELEQLKERYYEPGLLAKVTGFSKEYLRQVGGFDSIALYPEMQLRLDTAANRLHIRLQSRAGSLGKVSVFVNGKEIIEDANPPKGFGNWRDSVLTIDLARYHRFFLTDTINYLAVRAYNAEGWLKSAPQVLEFWSAPGPQAKGTDAVTGLRPLGGKRPPHLYIVAVGTSNYAGAGLDLNFADQDARAMADALRQTGAPLFGADSVSVYLLTTDATNSDSLPSKKQIEAAFDAIRQRAKAEDVLVAYFSGHGLSYGDADRALFYYLTMELSSDKLDDAGLRAQRAISSQELTRWINDIPAQKQVLILDACNSGRVVENLAAGRKELNPSQIRALDRLKDRTGMFVLTGSAADKVSFEAGRFAQGLLTYSLLEGMSGLALTPDRRVEVGTLFEYARDRVPELAAGIGGVQTPMLLGPTGGSFPIGLKTDQVQIALQPAKPVFVRNVFLDAERYDDQLGLSKAMDQYFREQTVKGAQAELVYVDVPEYENAFSVKGLYSLSGDTVTVRGRFFRGKNPVEEPFEVMGKVTALDALVEAILERCTVCFK